MHRTGELSFFRDLAGLSDACAFAAHLAPLRTIEWVVYANPRFGGLEQVLAYLSRYTHRVAISNSRLTSADVDTATFRWKDYRLKDRDGRAIMRFFTSEFICRFCATGPDHRILHYGLLASAQQKANSAEAQSLLGAQTVK